ncbi:MAG: hypothetical protein ACLT1I_12360 [Mediterraneibacter faecis]
MMHGGGSLTALPIIETRQEIFQLIFDQCIYHGWTDIPGIRTVPFRCYPAVNPVFQFPSRRNAQIKAMKKVAGTLKLIYSQYETGKFHSLALIWMQIQNASGTGSTVVEVLKQKQNAPVPVEKQVAIFMRSQRILSKVVTEDVNV